jgi:hypothetical protein
MPHAFGSNMLQRLSLPTWVALANNLNDPLRECQAFSGIVAVQPSLDHPVKEAVQVPDFGGRLRRIRRMPLADEAEFVRSSS